MGRTCCVPGCKSNYGKVCDTSTFKFPKESVLREKWTKLIHRDNFEVNDKTVVCVKHFEPKFVVREDIFPIENGDPIRVPRKIPKLTNDAYPTIFHNQPSYHTISVPKERKNPQERVKQLQARDEACFSKWCEQDNIPNFDSFKSDLQKRTVYPFILSVKDDYVAFIKLKDDSLSDIPSISVCFKVSSSLEVQIFHNNVCLPTETFKWILQSEEEGDLKCNKWTKFENLVSHLNSFTDNSIRNTDKINNSVNFLSQAILSDPDLDEKTATKIKFSLEQLKLAITKQVRYSSELLIWAATISYSFPGAYNQLRRKSALTLPHPVYLRQFLCKIGHNTPCIGPSQIAFLREKSKYLQDSDKVVTVMLDEVYVNSKLSYKAGKILGMADNGSETETAGTMQVFMAASLHSDYKDVLALFPVKNMCADTLLKLTTEILKVMNDLGFDVVCLVADNHSTNRKMYELLCGGTLKPCISNPFDPLKSLFLLLDSVHLLKCIRNNWLNRCNEMFIVPNTEQTFAVINDILNADEGSAVCEYALDEVKFSDLRNLFHSEKNKLLKLAPNLSRKAMYPTSIERQNVSLAVSIFDSKNVVALEMLKSQGVDISNGTIQFLKLIKVVDNLQCTASYERHIHKK